MVTDSVVNEPRITTMTINEAQYIKMQKELDKGRNPSSVLGAWATDTPINSVADVRNKLAVSEEFKSDKWGKTMINGDRPRLKSTPKTRSVPFLLLLPSKSLRQVKRFIGALE